MSHAPHFGEDALLAKARLTYEKLRAFVDEPSDCLRRLDELISDYDRPGADAIVRSIVATASAMRVGYLYTMGRPGDADGAVTDLIGQYAGSHDPDIVTAMTMAMHYRLDSLCAKGALGPALELARGICNRLEHEHGTEAYFQSAAAWRRRCLILLDLDRPQDCVATCREALKRHGRDKRRLVREELGWILLAYVCALQETGKTDEIRPTIELLASDFSDSTASWEAKVALAELDGELDADSVFTLEEELDEQRT